MSKYFFVLYGNETEKGWWLKITNISDLISYHKEYASKYSKAFENILTDKDLGASTITHGKHLREMPLAQLIVLKSMNEHISLGKAIEEISDEVIDAQVTAMNEEGAIYINSLGGWCIKPVGKRFQFMWKDTMYFPNFTESDIKVSKFKGGTHYYAYIGNMEVRDGDIFKWNTREEAYNMAKSCLSNNL